MLFDFPNGDFNDDTINTDYAGTGQSATIEATIEVPTEVMVPITIDVDIDSGATEQVEIDPIAISVIQDVESTVEIQIEVPVGEEESYGGTVVSTATAPGS